MEFANVIIGPVVQLLMVPIKEAISFVVSSSSYVRKMHTRINQLDATAADVKTHMETNDANHLEIPHRIPDWLFDVKTIKARVESFPTGGNGCCNLKMRYNAGKLSSDVLKDIERLMNETISEIVWTDRQKPLGRIESNQASTSVPFHGSSNFESRDKIFKLALNYLQQNNKSTQMVALCGMGGVGKTTTMKWLKKVVEEKRMFDWVLMVVIGQTTNPIDHVQHAISDYLGGKLTETTPETRAESLRKRFKSMSEDGKKILVILDDLWEKINLEDVGLMSPLSNNIKGAFGSQNVTEWNGICQRNGNLEGMELSNSKYGNMFGW